MAIYHLSVKTVARSAGRSATAAAAYRAADRIECEREGRVHDYTRKLGVEHAEIIVPDKATWASSRATLWNRAELAENRKNSTVAREYEIALPGELSAQGRVELARGFAQAISDRYGVAADIAIHAPNRGGDQRNWHAHILTTTREVTAEGLGAKTRILDDQKTGPAQILELRTAWREMANEALEREERSERISEKSYATVLEEKREVLAQTAEGSAERLEAQREVLKFETLSQNLAPHLGPAVAAIEERERRRAEAENREYEPATRIGAEMHRASRVRETLRGYLQAFRSYAHESYAYAAERLQSALSLFGGERRIAEAEKERGAAMAPAAHSAPQAGEPSRVSKIEAAVPVPASAPGSFLARREAEQARGVPAEAIERGMSDRPVAEPALRQDREAESFWARREREAQLETGRESVAREAGLVPDAGPAPTREDPLELARSILARDDRPVAQDDRREGARQEAAAASPAPGGGDAATGALVDPQEAIAGSFAGGGGILR